MRKSADGVAPLGEANMRETAHNLEAIVRFLHISVIFAFAYLPILSFRVCV